MHRAVQTFTYPTADGAQGWVRAGDELDDDDPVIEGREALFTRVDIQPLPKRTPRKK